ncbi:MAG: hypothetical protein LC725_09700 [Lentisphaerae bacterium]|nr:hypothetical protein [Lentisphaerota bacterium]
MHRPLALIAAGRQAVFHQPGSNNVTAECGNTVTSTVVAFFADFTVESDDPHHSGMILTDNREATVTISIEGVSDPSALSFQLAANPVETGNLINNGGTSISFTPTDNPLMWRTSKLYWYGKLPDNCCWSNRYEYNFALTVNGSHTVSNRYAMDWPDEDPKMNGTVKWPSTTVINEPELVPGFTNYYRCLIEFGDFPKQTQIIGIPTTCQYATEIANEEEYHALQWMGEVGVEQGGQGDCFTAKGLKWWIGWVGEGPWYTYGNTPEEALADAIIRVSTGQDEEWNKSEEIILADHGFVELKAKEYVNYNAAFKYHCTYEPIYGPNPTNHHHPAY